MNTPLDNKHLNIQWGTFQLKELFNIDDNWVYGKNKKWITKYESMSEDRLPVISGITTNNGVNYYTSDVPKETEKFSDCLTISTRGEYSGTVTYHKGDFVLANNILVLQMPILSENQKLFIGTLINSLSYGGYDNYPTKNSLAEDKIKLPIKNDGDVDYEFMDKFINELKVANIEKINNYLDKKNLSTSILTNDENVLLNEILNKKWEEYKVADLFEVKSYKKKYDANKVTILDHGYPYISRSSKDNGLRGFIIEDEQFLNNGNTISFGQDTATMFYQQKPYFTSDKIKILESRYDNFNENIALFLITTMEKSFYSFEWGRNSFSEDIINSQKIMVPVNDKKEIDYEYMDKFINIIEKKVIKKLDKISK